MTGFINAPVGLTHLRKDTVRALAGSNGEPSELNPFVTDTDPRLTEDKIADSIRTASTVIDIATADAPLTDQVLTALDASSANWQYPVSDTAPLDITKDTASAGTSPKAARVDHKHNISTAAPSTIGTTNSEGTSTALARADHIHAHGDQLGGTLHSLATQSTAGFMSAADKRRVDEFLTPGALPTNRFDLYASVLQTTSTTAQLFRTWSATDIEAGTYLLRWMWTFRTQSYQTPGVFVLRLNGGLLLQFSMAAAYNGNEVIGAMGIANVPLTAGTHSFQTYISRFGTTSRWVEIRQSYIELIKAV